MVASLLQANLINKSYISGSWVYAVVDHAFTDTLAPYVAFLNEWAPFRLYAPVLRAEAYRMEYFRPPIHLYYYDEFVEELLWSLISAGHYGKQDTSLVSEYAKYLRWMWPHEITRARRVFNMILRVFLVDALGGACIWEETLLPHKSTELKPKQSYVYAYDPQAACNDNNLDDNRVTIPIEICQRSAVLREFIQDDADDGANDPVMLECDMSAFALLREWFATGFVDGMYTGWERVCAYQFAHRYNISQLQRVLFSQDLMRFIQIRLNRKCLRTLSFIKVEYQAMLDSYGIAYSQADATMKPIFDVLEIVFATIQQG